MYDGQWVKDHYDSIGEDEINRLFKTPEDEIKFEVHAHYLRQSIKKGDSVLEIGAGPGAFTGILHELGAKITVADISERQIEANKKYAQARGFASSVESWHVLDICDLSTFKNETFDHIVAYGGPLSYVFEKAGTALDECRRVLKNGGCLISSVMSLYGTVNGGILSVLNFDLAVNMNILRTGDLTAENLPGHRHFCRLYSSETLRELLAEKHFTDTKLAGSSFLSTKLNERLADVRANPEKWAQLIALEIATTKQAGCTDSSSHIISVSRKRGA